MIEKLVCFKDLQYIGGNYKPNGIYNISRMISKGTLTFGKKSVNSYARINSSDSITICGFENEEDRIDYTNFLKKHIRQLAPRIFFRCFAKLLCILFILYFIGRTLIYIIGHNLAFSSVVLSIATCVVCIFLIPGISSVIDSV